VLFDMFAHWLVAENGFFKKPIPDPRDENERPVDLDRNDRSVAQVVMERMFPIDQERRSSAQLLSDAIRSAHKLNRSNWEITLFKDRIRLNVGRMEVMVLYPGEIYLV